MALDIKYEGWLLKKRKKGLLGVYIYQKRWFCLREHMFNDIRKLQYLKEKGGKILGEIDFQELTSQPSKNGAGDIVVSTGDRTFAMKSNDKTIQERWLSELQQAYKRHLGSKLLNSEAKNNTVVSNASASGNGKVIQIGEKDSAGQEVATRVRIQDERKNSRLGVISVDCYTSTTVKQLKQQISQQCKKRGKNVGQFNLSHRYKDLADSLNVLTVFTAEERRNKALQLTLKELDSSRVLKKAAPARRRKKKTFGSDDDTEDDSDVDSDEERRIDAAVAHTIKRRTMIAQQGGKKRGGGFRGVNLLAGIPQSLLEEEDEVEYCSSSAEDDEPHPSGLNDMDMYCSSSANEIEHHSDELELADSSSDEERVAAGPPSLPESAAPAIPSSAAPSLPDMAPPQLPTSPTPIVDTQFFDDAPPPLPASAAPTLPTSAPPPL